MKIKILIPTFNEKLSIISLLEELSKFSQHVLSKNISIDIFVIDDNSPDKTADLVEEWVVQHRFDNIEVLRRKNKDGLGNAYKAGIKLALADPEITHVVSMDADGSHQVSDLHKLIGMAADRPEAALVLGSRWMPGGGIENWSLFRKYLSKVGTRYARWALKLPLTDLTGGFRIYPRWSLERIDLNQITSNGYCYQIEMAFAIKHLNKEIIEVPIIFQERSMGRSKMSRGIVLEAIGKITWLGLDMRLRPNADKLHYVK